MTPTPTDRVRGLYAVTPDTRDTAALLTGAAAALKGGARVLQYRDKSADAGRRLETARELARLCRQHAAAFIVNDDVELALLTGADGVHVGEDDGDLAAIRQRIGPGRLLGASCYNRLDLALAALRAGADYVAFGSFYPSATKPAARRADLDLLQAARRQIKAPIVCIGGIDLDNAPPLLAAGADAIAVITALFGAADVEAAARALTGLFPPD